MLTLHRILPVWGGGPDSWVGGEGGGLLDSWATGAQEPPNCKQLFSHHSQNSGFLLQFSSFIVQPQESLNQPENSSPDGNFWKDVEMVQYTVGEGGLPLPIAGWMEGRHPTLTHHPDST